MWELGIQVSILPLVFAPQPLGLAGCRVLARLFTRRGSRYRHELRERLPREIPRAFALGPSQVLRESEAMMLYERVLVLRGALLPWWTQTIRLNGIEHVHAALEAGHGAILWVHQCLGSNVSVKQALFEAGLPLAHLSRPSHGFSRFPFGVRFANPLLRRAENRFLAERVVIDERGTVGPLRRLHVLLSENRVISIAVAGSASRKRSFPILSGSVLLPTGPVKIADRTGAAILPVFTGGGG